MIDPKKRMIKPAFFASVQLSKVSFPARLLFIALWTIADREGRLELEPELIKLRSLPYDKCLFSCPNCQNEPKLNINQLLNELAKETLVIIYGHRKYVWIPTFKEHQKIHANEKPSQLPTPPPLTSSQIDLLEKHPKVLCNGNGNGNGKGNGPPVEIIVGHLNRTITGHYKADSQPTIDRIHKLWRLGWRLADFEYVHIVKAQEWLGKNNHQYLRPKTLYSPENFESYRNQKMTPNLPTRLANNLAAAAAYLRSQGIEPERADNGVDADHPQGRIDDARGRGSITD